MMRQVLEANAGARLYLFTTFGAVYAGVVDVIDNDVVQLRGADGRPVYVNLADVSSVRPYDEGEPR